jgi:serine/threonine protein kinase/tetratricopeptide (TPR) repeat protein
MRAASTITRRVVSRARPPLAEVSGSSSCLAEDVASRYVDDELSTSDRERVELHLDLCTECRELISTLARIGNEAREGGETGRTVRSSEANSSSPTESSSADGLSPLARGSTIDRFVVLDFVGAGGMGVVYAAYDPELDRKVALKVLHDHKVGGMPRGRSVMVREARAMARVAHPNVVTVHDVDTFGDRTFIAMEFVEGQTLRTWLSSKDRSVSEIIAAFSEAGSGLAAAHRAGIVHRDFKPENVLVGDDDRARVTDFGLALRPETAASLSSGDAVSSKSAGDTAHETLSRPGTVVGTPAYMSPEQLSGGVVDARSDQFGFCVALYQALYGELPFAGGTAEALHDAIAAGRQRSPSTRANRVPRAVREVLIRGLAFRAEDRFASMDELLDALSRANRGSRRRRMIVFSMLLAALVLGAGSYASHVARRDVCEGNDTYWSNVWDDRQRAAVRRQFIASGAPFANDAAATVVQVLDRHTDDWTRARASSCEATRVRHEVPEETHALRVACLDRLREEVQALSRIFVTADVTVVEHAAEAAHKLTPISVCTDATTMAMQPLPPSDPTTRATLNHLRLRLTDARMLLDAGRYSNGLVIADEVVDAARRAGYAPVLAEALYLQGVLRDETSDPRGAETSLYEAATTAESAHHDRVAADCWTRLVWVVGYRQAKYAVGNALAHSARGAVLRAGDAPALAAALENGLGTVWWAEGRYAEARGAFEKAVVLWRKAHGNEHPFVASALNNLGLVAWNEGAYEPALTSLNEALVIRRKLLGADHPVVASSLNNVGLAYYSQARFDAAAEQHREAVAIYERRSGAAPPGLANALNNLGLAQLAEQKHVEALSSLTKALALRQKSRPAEHPDIANSHINLAMAYGALKDYSRALDHFEIGHAMQLRLLGAEHPDLVETLSIGASLACKTKELEKGRTAAERAVALAEKMQPEHPRLVLALTRLGQCQLALGSARDAAATFERAMSRGQPSDPVEVAVIRLGLARSLRALRKDRERTLQLLATAREHLREAGPRSIEISRDLDSFAVAVQH